MLHKCHVIVGGENLIDRVQKKSIKGNSESVDSLGGSPYNVAVALARQKDIHIITLCHGPGTLMSAKIDSEFIFNGYEIALFPDSVDKQTPIIGYLPGHMPFKLGEKLKELGMHIINKKADDTCHIDRNLITGASPYASNKLGRLAAEILLKVVN